MAKAKKPAANDERLVPLRGSERYVLPGAREAGAPPEDERLDVTVYVRRDPEASELPDPDELGAQLPHPGRHVSNEDFTAARSAAQADLDKVMAYAREHDLDVTEVSPVKRSVRLEGTVAQIERAFGVQLQRFEYPGGSYRGRTGPVHVPADLEGVVEAVLGLDNRPIGKAYLRRHAAVALDQARVTGLPPNTYLPPQLAQLYAFPPGADGSGQCVAILAFNDISHGGYELSSLTAYYEQVLQQQTPEIVDVVVRGQGNDPGSDSPAGAAGGDSSGEIMLDMCMVGALAPGAKMAMYFTEFTEQGWVDAITAIVTDTDNNPSVISCSYGNPEDDPRSAWTPMAIARTNEAFRDAARRGVTICCASGDDGSRDQGGGPRAHADFPASSPYVLGCGGTRLLAQGAQIASETVWNDGPGSATGGGVSRLFGLPWWQRHVGVPPSVNPGHKVGRGVPDVAALADPETGPIIISLDGRFLAVVGGTSAAAPLWAALVARLNQGLGARVGFLNPVLYTRFPYGVLRDVVLGNNGAYHAGPGWDACTGLGSPNGVALLLALGQGQLEQPAAEPPPALRPFVEAHQRLAERLSAALSPEPSDPAREAHERYLRAWREAAALDPRDPPAERARRLQALSAEADDALRAWREAVESQAPPPEQLEQQLKQALAEYLEAVRSAWQELDVASSGPEVLMACHQSVATALGQAAMAMHGLATAGG
jgi:kumamolisin